MAKSTKNKLENPNLNEIKLTIQNIKNARQMIRSLVKKLEKIGHYDEADELETIEMYELDSIDHSLKILKNEIL
jgi:hypothetical protein